jgi:hypothetical protein
MAVAAIAGAVILPLALIGGGSPAAASAPTASSTPQDPVIATAQACQQTLGPWTQYLANNMSQGASNVYTSAVGLQSPIYNIPWDGARVYTVESYQIGSTQASADAYAKVNQECNSFAQANPNFDFTTIPPVPSNG